MTAYINANLNKTLLLAHVFNYIIPKNAKIPIIAAKRQLSINDIKKYILGKLFMHLIIIIEIILKPIIKYVTIGPIF